MARIKRGVTTHARHKKIIRRAKTYYGRRKNTFRCAAIAVDKALLYAYRDRKTRKRDFRRLWIQRVNAACRLHQLTYGRFIHGLKRHGIELDRKSLAELAIAAPHDFEQLCALVATTEPQHLNPKNSASQNNIKN